MAAAVFDLARSSSAIIGLLLGDAQAVLRPLAGRVVIRPDGYIAAFAELVTRFNDSADRPSGKGAASANSSAPCLAPCPTLPGS